MPAISVMMSVYNESENEIRAAVDSILTQTFSDFELIIVNDNPDNLAYPDLLESLEQDDSRIRALRNEKQMGLALSMNRAAASALAPVLARMDADDISEPERFEIQYALLTGNGYDIVFSLYSYIDEAGNPIPDRERLLKVHTPGEIPGVMMLQPLIHHPTVMMTKALFEKTQGYRDFPCAQDYDLWLRCVDCGARFYMVDKQLLRYRIRSSGITGTRQFQQRLTIEYARQLMKERIRCGSDSCSIEHYQAYLKARGGFEEAVTKRFFRYEAIIQKSLDCRLQGRKLRCLALRIWVFMVSGYHRRKILDRWSGRKSIEKYVAHIYGGN